MAGSAAAGEPPSELWLDPAPGAALGPDSLGRHGTEPSSPMVLLAPKVGSTCRASRGGMGGSAEIEGAQGPSRAG
eukprot:4862081-Heterocapsa_arctica.AAC.1